MQNLTNRESLGIPKINLKAMLLMLVMTFVCFGVFGSNVFAYESSYSLYTSTSSFSNTTKKVTYPDEKAIFPNGTRFNGIIKTLAAGESTESNKMDEKIKTIEYIDSPLNENNNISITSIPIYIGWDESNERIWWSSPDPTPIANADCTNMFNGLKSLTNVDMHNWDTTYVESIDSMFEWDSSLQNINFASNWEFEKLTYMSETFNGCTNLENIDGLANWNVSTVKYMSNRSIDSTSAFGNTGTFANCTSLTDISAISNWRCDSLENAENMFYCCSNIKNVSDIDVLLKNRTNSINISQLFYKCNSIEIIDVSNWDLSKISNWTRLFYCCSGLKTIYVNEKINASNYSNLNQSVDIFSGCSSLKGGYTTEYKNLQATAVTYFRVDSPSQNGYLTLKESYPENRAVFPSGEVFDIKIKSLAANNEITNPTSEDTNIKKFKRITSPIDTNNNISISNIPIYIGYDNSDNSIWFSSEDEHPILNKDSSKMFYWIHNIESIDLTTVDTSYVIDMSTMFNGTESLTTLDLSSFNTEKVTDFSNFLAYNYNLTSVTLSDKFKTNSAKTLSMMFSGCKKLSNLDVSNWDTKNVTSLSSTFDDCYNLKALDVSNWDVSNVTQLSWTFGNCKNLESLDVSKWNLKNITSLDYSFYGCEKLKYLDLRGLDTSKVKRANYTFNEAKSLITIFATKDFVWTNLESSNNYWTSWLNYSGMFQSDDNLIGGYGTDIDKVRAMPNSTNITDGIYAICDSENTPGYLTKIDTSKSAVVTVNSEKIDLNKSINISKNPETSVNIDSNWVGTLIPKDNEKITSAQVKINNVETTNFTTKSINDMLWINVQGVNNNDVITIIPETKHKIELDYHAGEGVGTTIEPTNSRIPNIAPGETWSGKISITHSYLSPTTMDIKADGVPFTDYTIQSSVDTSSETLNDYGKYITLTLNNVPDCEVLTINAAAKPGDIPIILEGEGVKSIQDGNYSSRETTFSKTGENNWYKGYSWSGRIEVEPDYRLTQTEEVYLDDQLLVKDTDYSISYNISTSSASTAQIQLTNNIPNTANRLRVKIGTEKLKRQVNLNANTGKFQDNSDKKIINPITAKQPVQLGETQVLYKSHNLNDDGTIKPGEKFALDYSSQNYPTSANANIKLDGVTYYKVNVKYEMPDNGRYMFDLNVGNKSYRYDCWDRPNTSGQRTVEDEFIYYGSSVDMYYNCGEVSDDPADNVLGFYITVTPYQMSIDDSTFETPTKANCEFVGWNTEPAGNGTWLKDWDYGNIPQYDSIEQNFYAIYNNPDRNITLHSNVGTFEDGTTEKTHKIIAGETIGETVTKYSHTPNVSIDGTQNGNYSDNANTNEVITIAGSSELKITITYSGEGTSWDWACIWEGNHPDYSAYNNYSSSISGKLGDSPRQTQTYTIPGDTCTIGFRSDGSGQGDGYGYYAIVKSISFTPIITSEFETVKYGNEEFLGWNEKPDGSGKYVNKINIDEFGEYENVNLDLYAIFKHSQFIDGQAFNAKIKQIADNNTTDTYETSVSKITGFERLTEPLDKNNIVSTNNSSVPIYVGFNSSTGKIWWSCDNENVMLPENASYMFANLPGMTEIDITPFDSSETTNMDSMFAGDTALTTITSSGTFDTSKVASSVNMFNGDTALVGGAGTAYNANQVTHTYAKLDEGESAPGYFSLTPYDTKIKLDENPLLTPNNSKVTSEDLASVNSGYKSYNFSDGENNNAYVGGHWAGYLGDPKPGYKVTDVIATNGEIPFSDFEQIYDEKEDVSRKVAIHKVPSGSDIKFKATVKKMVNIKLEGNETMTGGEGFADTNKKYHYGDAGYAAVEGEQWTAKVVMANTDYKLKDNIEVYTKDNDLVLQTQSSNPLDTLFKTQEVGEGETLFNDYTFNPETGEITFNALPKTDEIVIKTQSEIKKASATFEGNDKTESVSGFGQDVVDYASAWNGKVKAAEGYKLPNIVTIVVGDTVLDPATYTYNKVTGEITIPAEQVHGNIVVKANAVQNTDDKLIEDGNVTTDATGGLDVNIPVTKVMEMNDKDATIINDYTFTMTPGTVAHTQAAYQGNTSPAPTDNKVTVKGEAFNAINELTDGKKTVVSNTNANAETPDSFVVHFAKDQIGQFHYTVVEDPIDGLQSGVTMDTNKYDVVITIENDDPTNINSGNVRCNGITVTKLDANGTPLGKTAEGENAVSDRGGAGDDINNVVFTNRFHTANVLVDKTVNGSLGDKTRDFTFTFNVTGTGIPTTYKLYKTNAANETAEAVDVQNGSTFTLKHSESAQIMGIPEGAHYSIVETGVADYTTNINATLGDEQYNQYHTLNYHNGSPYAFGSNGAALPNAPASTGGEGENIAVSPYSDEWMSDGVAVTANSNLDEHHFTNSKGQLIPTGLIENVTSFLGLALVAAFAVAYMIYSRRKGTTKA